MKTITLLAAIGACLMALVQVYFSFCSIIDIIDGYGLFDNIIINLIFTLGYGMLSTFFSYYIKNRSNMKKITIFGIVGAALLLIGSLALFILLVSYDANFTAIEYFSYLLSWTFDIILIVFFVYLIKNSIIWKI